MPMAPPVHRPHGILTERQRKKEFDRSRQSAAKRGYGRRWRAYRLTYLAAHPLCVECARQGSIEEAQHVDHIEAVDGPHDPRFWDPANHQGLCHSHHSAKTATRDSAFAKRG